MAVLRDLFTGVNGDTYDLGRVLWGGAIMAPLGAAYAQVAGYAVNIFRAVPLTLWSTADWAVWATAIAGLMISGATSLFIKRDTEPSVKVTQTRTDGAGNTATAEVKI